jgi:CDP-glycerol glycerophosphotransferase
VLDHIKQYIKKNRFIYKIVVSIIDTSNYISSLLLFLFISVFFKVNPKKILLTSYNHTKISCNPKYITKYILSKKEQYDYELIWIIKNDKVRQEFFGEFDGDVKYVKFKSPMYYYHMATSKFIISNQRTNFYTKKRKNQIYIQTWHSMARIKKIEKDAEHQLSDRYINLAKEDSLKTDLITSGSKQSTEIFENKFWYKGKILNIGTPRNDILFTENEKLISEIREKIKIDKDKKIILYAPTFRSKYPFKYDSLDFEKIKEALKLKFNNDFVFLIKKHPNLTKKISNQINSKEFPYIDVSFYEDIQELLLVSDILISDYSSVVFDFALTKKPCFLFVPDIDDYYKKERNTYFKIEDLPFNSSKTSEDLIIDIFKFNKNEYVSNLTDFLSKKISVFENGNACAEILKYINERSGSSEKI